MAQLVKLTQSTSSLNFTYKAQAVSVLVGKIIIEVQIHPVENSWKSKSCAQNNDFVG
jgi:hypothetical protein